MLNVQSEAIIALSMKPRGRVNDLLSKAPTDGLEDSQVIHGKGTGTLRRAMWGYNDNHPLALT